MVSSLLVGRLARNFNFLIKISQQIEGKPNTMRAMAFRWSFSILFPISSWNFSKSIMSAYTVLTSIKEHRYDACLKNTTPINFSQFRFPWYAPMQPITKKDFVALMMLSSTAFSACMLYYHQYPRHFAAGTVNKWCSTISRQWAWGCKDAVKATISVLVVFNFRPLLEVELWRMEVISRTPSRVWVTALISSAWAAAPRYKPFKVIPFLFWHRSCRIISTTSKKVGDKTEPYLIPLFWVKSCNKFPPSQLGLHTSVWSISSSSHGYKLSRGNPAKQESL